MYGVIAAFEDAMRKREHESRKQADEMSVSVLAHDMKVKLLSKEVELAKVSEQSHRQRFEEMENNARELEKKLKQKEWELADVTTMKDVMWVFVFNVIRFLLFDFHHCMIGEVCPLRTYFEREGFENSKRSGKTWKRWIASCRKSYRESMLGVNIVYIIIVYWKTNQKEIIRVCSNVTVMVM